MKENIITLLKAINYLILHLKMKFFVIIFMCFTLNSCFNKDEKKDKIKSNKNQKYDDFINVIDVLKRIDYISDSLKFTPSALKTFEISSLNIFKSVENSALQVSINRR